MTKDKALRMAIEWLDNQQLGYSGHSVRKACQDALAQPTAEQSSLVQEPVAWNEEEFNAIAYAYRTCPIQEVELVSQRYQELVDYVLIITTPPSREWQSLNDEEIGRLAVFDGLHHVEIPLLAKFIIAIDKALREKNELF